MADALVFRSSVVAIGRHELSRELFPADPPVGAATNLIVFPRSTQEISPTTGGSSVVTDRNSVLLYNRGESYPIRFIDPVDRCDYLAFGDEWALEIAGEVDPQALHRPHRPFDRFHSAANPALYWRARRLVRAAASRRLSSLATEEAALALARSAFTATRDVAFSAPGRISPTHRRLVEDVKELFAERHREDLSVDDIALEVGASPAHLARVFRRVAGTTMHRYRAQLRLRTAADELDSADLSTIALNNGFSSHSHFSAAFRGAFDRTPSQARRELAGAQPSNSGPS